MLFSVLRALNSLDKARLVPTVGCVKMQKHSFFVPVIVNVPVIIVGAPEYYADHGLLFFGTELTDITDATVIIY